jgi:antirestriction protein ArdC
LAVLKEPMAFTLQPTFSSGLSGYVAEMCAAFCCAALGIMPTVRHADYIGAWLEVLRDDNRAIVRAASQASKAADWLLGHLPEMQGGDADAAAIDHEVVA